MKSWEQLCQSWTALAQHTAYIIDDDIFNLAHVQIVHVLLLYFNKSSVYI